MKTEVDYISFPRKINILCQFLSGLIRKQPKGQRKFWKYSRFVLTAGWLNPVVNHLICMFDLVGACNHFTMTMFQPQT